MRKLLMILAVGALLASCNSTQDKEAAAEFCKCYNLAPKESDASPFEMLENFDKSQKCVKKWQSTYEGKVTEDGFGSELKEQCPDAHAKAEEMGMFK
jgi:hypothetical protein